MMFDEFTGAEAYALYECAGAIWSFDYDGDLQAPHAALTKGLCSDTYVNSELVLSDLAVTQRLVGALVAQLRRLNPILPVDWVVGSSYGAITFSYELARQIGARHGFTKRDPADPTRHVWTGPPIPGGAFVLQAEELIVTLGTTFAVRRAIEGENPEPVRFLSDVATLFYRPPRISQNAPLYIRALITDQMRVWSPAECPLCRAGSTRLRPRQHWRELMAGRQP